MALLVAGTWTLTLLPNAPDNNTYTVVNSQRPTVPAGSTCWGTLSTPECQYGDGVDEFAYVILRTANPDSTSLLSAFKLH